MLLCQLMIQLSMGLVIAFIKFGKNYVVGPCSQISKQNEFGMREFCAI